MISASAGIVAMHPPIDLIGEQLLEASHAQNIELMRELIQNKADVNFAHPMDPTICHQGICRADSATPLIIAIESGSTDIVRMLVNANANVFKPMLNPDYTPLRYALISLKTEIAEMIIEQMLYLPHSFQKERIYTFLICLKRIDPIFYGTRILWKKALFNMVHEENEADFSQSEASRFLDHTTRKLAEETAGIFGIFHFEIVNEGKLQEFRKELIKKFTKNSKNPASSCVVQ